MGVIMGTAAYMSPEQARGKPVDKRADIWAFGAVLFEMLTSKKTFAGEDVSLTLSAVLQREPDWNTLPQDVPPALDTYLRRCLEKNPRQRIRDSGDVRLAIDGAFEAKLAEPGNAAAAPEPGSWQRPIPVTVAIVAALVIGGVSVWLLAPKPGRALGQFVISTTQPLAVSTYDSDLVISPDGQQVVYTTGPSDSPRLYVRPVDELAGTVIDSSDHRSNPFVSPDGAWIGFFSETDQLWQRVPISGGPPLNLFSTQAPSQGQPRGASWGVDDTIVFANARTGAGLFRGTVGEEPVPLTTPNAGRGETRHYWPELLPNGEAALFMAMKDTSEDGEVAVVDLATGEHKPLIPIGNRPRYAASGHIVYGVGSALWAVPFDAQRLEVTGDPIRVLEGVQSKSSVVSFSLSESGSLAYVLADALGEPQRTLTWIDRQGEEERLDSPARPYVSARIAPDGDRIALALNDEDRDIWMWNVTRKILERFTSNANADQRPLWTPNGERVLFRSAREGMFDMYWKAADGTGSAVRLLESPIAQSPSAISPDGTKVLFSQRGQQVDLYTFSLSEEGAPEALVATPFSESTADVSPNGQWLTYQSDASTLTEIYVTSFPDVGEAHLISRDGGSAPRWGPRGDELFYMGGGELMRVPIEWNDGPEPGTPEALFSLAGYVPTFDIAPDGRRFLMIKEDPAVADAAEPEVVLIQNWTEELKERVPLPLVMLLEPGTTLGPYEVTAKIGEGGMDI